MKYLHSLHGLYDEKLLFPSDILPLDNASFGPPVHPVISPISVFLPLIYLRIWIGTHSYRTS